MKDSPAEKVLLIVHIAAVIAAFGPWVLHPLLLRAAERAGGEQAAAVHRAFAATGVRAISIGGAVVLVAGIVLAAAKDMASEPWVAASLVILVGLLAVAGAVTAPGERRLAELATGDDTTAYTAALARQRAFTFAALAGVLVALVLMVVRPG